MSPPVGGSTAIAPEVAATLAAVVAAAALVAFLAARALLPAVLAVLREGGLVHSNYLGHELPVGAGVVIPLASLGSWLFLFAVVRGEVALLLLWIALLFGMGFLGLLDDAAGNRRRKGFAGHVKALLEGKPTTGSLKALFGGSLALVAGLALYGPSAGAFVSGALIALSANAVNLLDVRPGRALKGAAILSAAAAAGCLSGVAMSPAGPAWPAIHPAAWAAPFGASLALWRGDHKGDFMMGDAGANVLGAAAGLLAAGSPLPWQGILLLLLIALHFYSERRSLSELIEASPFLDRLDRWGR